MPFWIFPTAKILNPVKSLVQKAQDPTPKPKQARLPSSCLGSLKARFEGARVGRV